MDLTDMQREEIKQREEAVKNAAKETREMYKPDKIKHVGKKKVQIRVGDAEKEKTIETRTFENGVKKSRLVEVTKNGKRIFHKA